MSILEFTRFDIISIYGIDIGDLLKSNDIDSFNSSRGTDEWFFGINEKISNANKFGFNYPKLAHSLYSDTDRAVRSTFSDYYVDRLMPLHFTFIEQPIFYQDGFVIKMNNVSLSRKGAITIEVEINLEDNCTYDLNEIITQYYKIKIFIKQKVYDSLLKCIKLINQTIVWELQEISFHTFQQKLLYFESIDFDYNVAEMVRKPIKELYDDVIYLQQFAVLSRMSKVDFKNYDLNKLNLFKKMT